MQLKQRWAAGQRTVSTWRCRHPWPPAGRLLRSCGSLAATWPVCLEHGAEAFVLLAASASGLCRLPDICLTSGHSRLTCQPSCLRHPSFLHLPSTFTHTPSFHTLFPPPPSTSLAHAFHPSCLLTHTFENLPALHAPARIMPISTWRRPVQTAAAATPAALRAAVARLTCRHLQTGWHCRCRRLPDLCRALTQL